MVYAPSPRCRGAAGWAAPGRRAQVTRRAWLARALAAPPALALLGCAPQEAPRSRALDVSGASYGLDFRLTDPQGHERSLADYRGKVVMLFFGFVQCPDVCPMALQRGAEVLRLLGDDGSRIQGLFVSLDPERDSAQTLREYTAAFHPSFVGLRGDVQRTQQTAEHFKVYYRKVPFAGSYTLEHSAMTYVYDPAGKLRLALRAELSAREAAADVAPLLPAAAGPAAG
jgi:protein SCO1/2